MDNIFIKEPIIGLLALFITALHIFTRITAKKSGKAAKILTAANIIAHIIIFTLIFLLGGDYKDALPLALISGIFALTACPAPNGGNR